MQRRPVSSNKHALVESLCLMLMLGSSLAQGTTSGVCGANSPNNIDLTESASPSPFRDLTTEELRKLRTFLENDPQIRASDPSNPNNLNISSSYIHTVDLFLAGKREIIRHLDYKGPRPERQARVLMFRGDKTPPVAEEYLCGPLPDVTRCDLMNLPNRRNPVEFTFRPSSRVELRHFEKYILPAVDSKVGYILRESYGSTFTTCEDPSDCLTFRGTFYGSGLSREPNRRLTWLNAAFNLPFTSLHILDFSFLIDSSSVNPSDWFVDRIWYGDKLFTSFDELISSYNSGTVNKTRVTKPANDENLFSSLRRRGEFQPPEPQRAPTLVEPDGKRYSVKDREVKYMGWSFSFRQSSLTGPAIYNVKFNEERIAYEFALSEIAVFYSGHAPYGQSTNYVDSGELLGSWSRSLVPGADCPDTSTLISTAYMSQSKREPDIYKAGFCLFENNNGYPLRRHLSYNYGSGSFYSGLMDSCLHLRSALTIDNYDYIIDFIFHPNGVLQARLMSTGYIQAIFYTNSEKPYGLHIHDHLLGNIHHHMAVFKADIDIHGTKNRYTTYDIVEKKVYLSAFPDKPLSQTTYKTNLKKTEKEAVLDYDFTKPKYHVVHNDAVKTNLQEIKGFRIQMNGMSKNLVAEGEGNENTISWGRHQMVVTKQKDHEISASSVYGMRDGYRPVVNFTSFYSDNEDIVDQDLVFWITSGMHHIPHTEDIPVTPTVGNHLELFLLPYNFFTECPSMGSRDAIYVEHVNINQPNLGVTVNRHGNSRDQCVIPKATLEEDVKADPNRILETSS